MVRNRGLLIGAMMASVSAQTAWAQTTAPQVVPPQAAAAQTAATAGQTAPAADPAPEGTAGGTAVEAESEEIVVQGQKLPGSVVGDIPPEQTLSPADIRSYGVSSINDLLTELSPQTSSGRGRGGAPVVLLDGRRISSFAEIRDLPTEAIARVEILPEEVALKYGYAADQRVVNFVLRRRFRAVTTEVSGQAATDGGTVTPRGQLGLLKINRNGRMTLNLDYQQTSGLLESERDLIGRSTSGVFDLAGNITPGAGLAQIDALSAAAGRPITVAGVPASGTGTLGGYAAGTANVTDLTPYRSLTAATQNFSANTVYSRVIGNVPVTLNARVETTSSQSDQGLAGISVALPAGNRFSPFGQAVTLNRYVADDVLGQSNEALNAHLGLGANGTFGRWRWTLTGNYDRNTSETFTDVNVNATGLQAAINANDPNVNPFGPLSPALVTPGVANTARSVSQDVDVTGLVNGPLFHLPAGDASTTLRVGYANNDLDSRAFRLGVASTSDVTRSIGNGQVNIDLPITSRSRDFLSALGNLSLNGNYRIEQLNDFGTLSTYGYGLNWSPIVPLRLLVSFTDEENAPSPQQLGNPLVSTPNARIFDYVRGTTVDVTRLSGGNAGLVAENRHAFKAGFNLQPFSGTDFRLQVDYTRQSSDNPIASFPSPTAAIEAAFPQRFVRDANGALLSYDARPVNFQSERQSQLRWGVNFSKPIKNRIQKQLEAFRAGTGPNPFAGMTFPGQRRPGGQGGAQGAPDGAPPTAGGERPAGEGRSAGGGERRGGFGGGPGGGGFRGGGGGFGGGQGGGRINFAFYHTWHFEDEVVVRDGVPVLDNLNGAATRNDSGTPRHELELQAGYSNNGLGVRLTGEYQSATQVFGGTSSNAATLNFDSLTTFNLRLFDDLGGNLSFVRKHPWARGMRVSFDIRNVLNTRQDVTDGTGTVPINYQPAYRDAVGRTVRLSVRKLFF
ncbi:TonB-dependent receptor [Sphingomonas aracearum]|uniref:TonB-dependent receptor n=1 Tax=Sphingomonas aracearum TaxID=2283317 RepID=A0A369W042_9SPHN|nr:TonB-dependent receptor [Sphingomonas aracearum]RDE07419.1 TonB-dependent receptor [Sphingomonas aracearum]